MKRRPTILALATAMLLGLAAGPAAWSQREEDVIKDVGNTVSGDLAGKAWQGETVKLKVVKLLKRIQIRVRIITYEDGRPKVRFEPLRETRVQIRNYRNGKMLVDQVTDKEGLLPDSETRKIGVGVFSLRPVTEYPKQPYYYAGNFTLSAADRDKALDMVLDPSSVVYNVLSGKPVNGAKVGLHYEDGTIVNGPFEHFTANQMHPTPNGVQLSGGVATMTEKPVYDLFMGEFQYRNPETWFTAQDLKVKALNPGQRMFVSVDFEQGSELAARFSPVTRTQSEWTGYEQPYRGQVFSLAQDQGVGLQVPLVPITALKVTKMSNKTRASVGDVVAYRIKVENMSAEDTHPSQPIGIVDTLPVGLKYLPGTARLNGEAVEPVQSGNTLRFTIGSLRAKGNAQRLDQNSVVYLATLATSVVAGQIYENKALAQIQGITVSNTSSAAIRAETSPFADESLLIGKVFVDANRNAWQDPGERGLGGVRLVLEDGTIVTTDPDGKYSVPQLRPGRHVIKLDVSTLPFGMQLATDDSRFLMISRGLIYKQNFGVIQTTPTAASAVPSAQPTADPALMPENVPDTVDQDQLDSQTGTEPHASEP